MFSWCWCLIYGLQSNIVFPTTKKFQAWYVVYKDEGVDWKVSAKDLIVIIEIVCVEASRGVGELGESRPCKQTSPYRILDHIFCFFVGDR